MNFFQEQERARQHTMWLVGIFVMAVLSIILLTIFFVIGLYLYFDDVSLATFLTAPLNYIDPKFLYGIVVGVIMVVAGGSLYKYSALSAGGKSVAVALGGKQLNRNHATNEEQQLLNVVEEMSIASGISTPTVFVLDEEGINAFAAGLNFDDAIIGVTRGTIEKLNREELQGVIAHEFSHIFNGDMRLNLRLTATLHGILLIGLIGRFILRSFSGRSHRSSRSSSDKKNSGLYVLALGAGLFAIGYVGTFFGSLIKANVSRKREYLADATAVQYTRYPLGISGALKKIAFYSSTLQTPAAETYSHLYFAEGVSSFFGSLMATHPPLHDRIKRVEPRWSGKIPNYNKLEKHPAKEENREVKRDKEKVRKERFTQGAIAAAMMRVGEIKEEEVEEVKIEITALDKRIKERLNEPLGAQAVILALLYDVDYKKELFTHIQQANPYLLLEFASFIKEEHKTLKEKSTLIVALSLNALKNLSLEQYEVFKNLLTLFVNIDKHVTLFEWSLQYILQRPLEMHLGVREVPKRKHANLGAIKKEVELLYSMLAQAQYNDELEAKEAFNATKKTIQAGALQYIPKEQISHARFVDAVLAIEQVKPVIAERIFEGVLYSINIDGEISSSENAFVHAIAQLMQVPLPRKFKPGSKE